MPLGLGRPEGDALIALPDHAAIADTQAAKIGFVHTYFNAREVRATEHYLKRPP